MVVVHGIWWDLPSGVIKHGVLQNGPFILVIFLYNPPFTVDFPLPCLITRGYIEVIWHMTSRQNMVKHDKTIHWGKLFQKKSKPQSGTAPIDGLWQAMEGEVVLPRFSPVRQKDSRECLIIQQIIGKICYQKNSKIPNISNLSWWYTYPSEKYESQLGWWHSQYMGK